MLFGTNDILSHYMVQEALALVSCTKDLVNMTLTTTPAGNCESAMAVIFITVDILSHRWCKQPLQSVWTLVGRVFNIWWK